ncbi:MAG: hypothetical protein FHK82_16590, partial [Sedimenticola thiotaurini]
MERYVPLEREFSLVNKNEEEIDSGEFFSTWGYTKPIAWDDLYERFRCVVLAEAGAGKTEEFRQRAGSLADKGKPAFFIRIEDIEADFYTAFDIGDEMQFNAWLQSTEEAWFFLDSVDEARLENPRAFAKALKRFSKGIKRGAHRAHIYLSSRPYAWRPKEDQRLLDDLLYLPAPQEDVDENQNSKPESALAIYSMRHLDAGRIRKFCVARSAENIDRLLGEIDRANLWSLAERPFDLEGILIKWADDNTLEGRLALLRHNIDKRLRDEHCSDRAQRQPLNIEQAKEGARRLAAAVVLTGQVGINIPDATPIKPGIEAESVLADWNPQDVRALLERGVFNDIIYGAVRFRHRDVRELLAAEWFAALLNSGNSRHSVEALFFREQYGQKFITRRLRPILPWLVLFDGEVRRKALAIQPEITVESGDPSQLPLSERQELLANIVRRIALDEDDRSARDNSAIARIANPDLTEYAQQLIEKFGTSDDAIFFLGRLVWQGEMEECTPSLVAIATDNSRGIYARIASVRAVMTCGSFEQRQSLWQQLNESGDQIPHNLLAELVQEAAPKSQSVTQIVVSLGKLPPYERFEVTGLGDAIHKFIERLDHEDDHHALILLLNGLHVYLDMPPYVERQECHVSKEHAWLLSPAIHSVEKLTLARNESVLDETALSTMLMVPAHRHWHSNDLDEYKDNLHKLVPDWPELNDALYWASIEQARVAETERTGKSLTDDWPASWLGHFWNFDLDGLPRLLEYANSRSLTDDRAVALSTAFRVYLQNEMHEETLTSLRDAVSNDPSLQDRLEAMLNPPVSDTSRRHAEEHAEYERKREEEEEQRKKDRDTWIAKLLTNPNQVHTPSGIKQGELINNQYWLMLELHDRYSTNDRSEYANWKALIPDFGEAVAQAYRDAAMTHWRHYVPSLGSEEGRDNSIPLSLIFAMAGLEIEATENSEFFCNLDEEQARHALRYITWQLNGFPSWFERVDQAFPALTEEVVAKELIWELENTGTDKPMHYILHDIVYHAPWLHARIAPVILEWIEANPTRISQNRHYCLHILVKGEIDPVKLADLACSQITQSSDPSSIAWWYALRVDCDPTNSIPELEHWLSTLDDDKATLAAQVFITALIGGSHVSDSGPHFGNFRTAEHLKSLYILMHQYIRVQEDIDRSGGRAYSPNQRDDAQKARNSLFKLLSEIPGKKSYTVIEALAHEHPNTDYRPWMAKQAYKRAEEDGDLEPWTAEQVSEFAKSQTITPTTHHQIFDLAMNRLHDLKSWVERGNDSPWKTWQRVEGETEMRTLIAGWLNHQCRDQYTTAQEPELANSQRMDISLLTTGVPSPVPIELKLLDKGWSGPGLCERLRNQLVGDYLREESAGCGVLLLVWQGRVPEKRWAINGNRVGLRDLASALKQYWLSISLD